MSRWYISFIAIFILLASDSYADSWVDGTSYLHEETLFLNQVLGQEDRLALAPSADGVPEPAYEIGDERKFYSLNLRNNSQYTTNAAARAISDRAYIFVEKGRMVNITRVKSLLSAFDGIYDQITNKFGAPPDSIDRDPRVYILLLDILDTVQPDGSRVIGYYSSLNQYRNALLARWSDRRSNEVEMLYIDYTALNGSPKWAESVVAHEFTHMVQWARDPEESIWVNEGLAVYAEGMLGYEVENRISAFENNPDISLMDWNNTVEDYGAAYLFFAYLSERFDGVSTIASILKNRSSGTRGIERSLAGLGKSVSFSDLFSDWVVANYLDDPKLNKGIYGYATLDIDLRPTEVEILYPIAHKTSKVKSWAARYTEFKKQQDDTLNLTVYKDDGNDIVAQLIEFDGGTSISSVKSNSTPLGTATISPEESKVVLVVTSQPAFVVPGAEYSDYKYSAEIQAAVTPVEPVSGRKITTWGALKSD